MEIKLLSDENLENVRIGDRYDFPTTQNHVEGIFEVYSLSNRFISLAQVFHLKRRQEICVTNPIVIYRTNEGDDKKGEIVNSTVLAIDHHTWLQQAKVERTNG